MELFSGPIPTLRHGFRVALNRVWSLVLRRGLRKAGRAFDVDFTARILGGRAVEIGSCFHAARGLKIVVANPHPVQPAIRIGNRVCINEYVTLAAFDAIAIGDNVLIGSRVYIGNVNHGRYDAEGRSQPSEPPNSRLLTGSGETVIGANVWIGEGAILPGGVTVGAGSVIGAGAVVTRPMPPGVIVAGNPARIVREFDPSAGRWIRIGESIAAS